MEAILKYNRDVVVRCLTRPYELLVQMGYMEDSNILRAPPGGWDDTKIDAKSLRIMDRIETVIDILRHLPYLENVYEIMPATRPVKYLGERWDDNLAKTFAEHNSLVMLLYMPFESLPEPGMICLIEGRDSEALLLDTQTGKMYPFGSWTTWKTEASPIDQQEHPWLGYTQVSIEKYFDELLRKFTSLEFIPLPRVTPKQNTGIPDEEHKVYNSDQPEIISVKTVFHDHGWPNIAIFRRDECIKAANTARCQENAKREIRWCEQDIKNAEESGNVKVKEEAEQKLREEKMKYEREWGYDPSILYNGLSSVSLG